MKRTLERFSLSDIIDSIELFFKKIRDNGTQYDKEICSYEAVMIKLGYKLFLDVIHLLSAEDVRNQKIFGVFDYILDLDLNPDEICIESKFHYIRTGTEIKI